MVVSGCGMGSRRSKSLLGMLKLGTNSCTMQLDLRMASATLQQLPPEASEAKSQNWKFNYSSGRSPCLFKAGPVRSHDPYNNHNITSSAQKKRKKKAAAPRFSVPGSPERCVQ